MNVRKRVLVVDDDDSIRETVELALEDEGYYVQTAPNGKAALELMQGWQPDVILLDMKMPVMDGWAFAAAYRRRSEPRASIVVLTAAQDAARWGAEVQADGVLAKPFELEDLYVTVSEYAA